MYDCQLSLPADESLPPERSADARWAVVPLSSLAASPAPSPPDSSPESSPSSLPPPDYDRATSFPSRDDSQHAEVSTGVANFGVGENSGGFTSGELNSGVNSGGGGGVVALNSSRSVVSPASRDAAVAAASDDDCRLSQRRFRRGFVRTTSHDTPGKMNE